MAEVIVFPRKEDAVYTYGPSSLPMEHLSKELDQFTTKVDKYLFLLMYINGIETAKITDKSLLIVTRDEEHTYTFCIEKNK